MTEHEEIYIPPLLQYLIFVLYLVCVLGFPIMGGILSYLDNQEHKASENNSAKADTNKTTTETSKDILLLCWNCCACSCGQQFRAHQQ